MTALLVALGALVAAPLRYLTDYLLNRHWRGSLPVGTLAVNIVASFVLGLSVGAASRWSPHLQVFVATGIAGTLSTFSTFGYETVALGRDGKRLLASGYLLGSVAAGMAFGALGWVLGSA